MSMSDDPRGFRRGQPGNRDYPSSQPQQQPSRGARPAQPRDDRYEGYRQPEPPQARPERPQPPQEKPQQPAFSAYRPEAYAAPERRPPARPERAEWEDTPRSAPPAPPRSMPTSDPFPRTPPQPPSRDPYASGPSDPYAPASSQRGYENDWRQQDPYQDQGANQFPSFYPPHDEPSAGPDVQSVHNRFFAPDPEPEPAPPAQNRFRGSFDDHDHDHDFGVDSHSGFGSEPAQRHHGTQTFNSGFDDKHDSDWDKFEQAPPPASVRPFHPPATVPDDDLDADFFADEDDYDGEDYPAERRGGRKRMMAAVLLGAIVTGGGLAFLYKSGGNGSADGDGPSLISADNRPIKEEPTEPGGRDFPNKSKLIYERLAGASDGEAGGSRLSGASTGGVVSSGGTLEERIENALKAQKDEDQPTAASGKAASPDAPRTVRTMTFGPDGSPQAVRPSTQRLAANPPTTPDSVSQGIVVTSEATASSARDVPGVDDSERLPTAAPPQRVRQAPGQRAAAVAEAPAPSISESAGGTGNFFVQIAARNDQDAAMTAFASLQQKYAGVLGNHSPSVRKVDLGDKGVWYRLLVGPLESKTDAEELCKQLQTAGMKNCFARKD
ncbi:MULTISPECIES: SPOR domain-containing protein [Rhodomicrobium]|uniref:SPOR domain-containing protein n=1 Tax=Rhodomicrobium TaxID=1068 RepID=UPI000B4C1360|nr:MULTISPECIES: SPOR domain-containing protein [Rhodomicrobium]